MMESNEAFEVIEEVARLRGNSKQTYLKLNPTIAPYLIAAYNPYSRYYVTKCAKGEGDMEFNDMTWKVFERLSKRELTGHDAQRVVNSITAGMTRKSAELFSRILRKDLRMGMGAKTINKVFPGLVPIHEIMLAKLFDKTKIKYPCFGSPKIDGVRAVFKNGKFYSRKGHEYVGLNHIAKEIESTGIKEVLDGELTVNGVGFQEGSGLIRNYNPTPDAVFSIFDIPSYKGPFVERLIGIEDICNPLNSVNAVTHVKLNMEDQLMDFYTSCRELNFEGAVIKPYDYEYKNNRSYRWMKMKNIDTVDLEVKDLFEGKNKYTNQMGGAIVYFNGKPNKVGGGWSDNERYLYWRHPELIVGKTIEIAYMEETDDGNMRHARFIRMREDI